MNEKKTKKGNFAKLSIPCARWFYKLFPVTSNQFGMKRKIRSWVQNQFKIQNRDQTSMNNEPQQRRTSCRRSRRAQSWQATSWNPNLPQNSLLVKPNRQIEITNDDTCTTENTEIAANYLRKRETHVWPKLQRTERNPIVWRRDQKCGPQRL